MTHCWKHEMRSIFLILLTLETIKSEVYSSATDLKKVFSLERDLVDILENYSQELLVKYEQIQKYVKKVKSLESEVSEKEELMDKLTANPIEAFKLIKRFAVDWQQIEKTLTQNTNKDLELKIRKKKLSAIMPKEIDFHGSAKALLRLQEIYKLDVRNLSSGLVENVSTNSNLSAQDCLFLGKHSFNMGKTAQSLEWFERAYQLSVNDTKLPQDKIKMFMDKASKEHDSKLKKGETGPHLFPKPVSETSPLEQRAKLNMNEKINANQSESEAFSSLCRGIDPRPPKELAKLRCYYSYGSLKYLYPIKTELLHSKPEILFFYEVLTSAQMSKIRKLADPFLARSQVHGRPDGSSEVSLIRTSKTGWLQDSIDPIIQKISEKVSLMTGLLANTWNDEAELLQVANYVNGGHYNPHFDYIVKDKDPEKMLMAPSGVYIGDRIATWMSYINPVQSGGRTVFPKIGLSIKPVYGGAVFWHNLKKSGLPEKLTLHGACPILLGTKWVSNKWIREGAQTFSRPCGLTKEE